MSPAHRTGSSPVSRFLLPLAAFLCAAPGGLRVVPVAAAAPKTDNTVFLPISRLRVPVPGRVSDWTVDSIAGDGARMDVLKTAENAKPAIGIAVRVSMDPLGCSLPLNLQLGSFPPGTKKVQRPSYLPASFVPEAIESPVGGGKGIVVCANIPGGDVVIRIAYKGTRLDHDLAPLKPTFDAMAKQAASRPPAPAPTTPTSPPTRTEPIPPASPPPAVRLSLVPITLGTTGAIVRLPEGWRHEFLNEMQQPGRDLLIRQQAGMPELGISMEPPAREYTCSKWFDTLRNRPGMQMRERPAYVPRDYFRAVFESSNPDGSISRAKLCLDTKDNGLQEVTLVYAGTLTDPDVRAATPLLDQIAVSILTGPRVPDLPAPSTSTGASSTMVEPSTTSESAAERDRKRRLEEEERRRARSQDEDRPRRRSYSSSQLELSVYRVEPEGESYENTTGGSLGLSALMVDPGSIAWAGLASAMIGADGAGNIPLDLKLGLGAGLRVGPLMLVPLFELGADSMGGGDAGKYKVPSAFNYAVEGIANLALGDSFGIGGSIGRVFRGSMLGSANAEVPREDRLSGHLYLGTVSLGVRFVDYGTGKLTAGTLGLAF